MTPALLWFFLIIGSYALFTVLQAARQSSLSKPWHLGMTTESTALRGQKKKLLRLFVLANAVLVIFPASVYRFGLWGLLWPLVMALVYLIVRIVASYDLAGQWGRVLRKALVLLGSLWFLSWQLDIIVQFVTALSLDSLSVSILKTAITLFLLVTAIFAGERNLYDFAGSKLMMLCLFCILACVVLYAYIGGFYSFSQHIQNYYQLTDTSIKPVSQKALALWPSLKNELVREMVLALFFGAFVLALQQEIAGTSRFGQKTGVAKGRLVPFLAWIVMGIFCLGYSLFMGLGPHFTGADGLYLKSYSAQVSVLFDPVFGGLNGPNLPALFLKSLANILPSAVGVMTALIIIALLSTGRMLLVHASKLLSASVIMPIIGRPGLLKQEQEWFLDLWQMRSYTLILIAALFLSEL